MIIFIWLIHISVFMTSEGNSSYRSMCGDVMTKGKNDTNVKSATIQHTTRKVSDNTTKVEYVQL